MKFNSRVDLTTNPKVDTAFFNKKLEHVCDSLYVTFVATREGLETDAWQDKKDTFLRLVLPYEEVEKSNKKGKDLIALSVKTFSHLP